jgi:RNA polymerase sigma factor (sigma-70 family)
MVDKGLQIQNKDLEILIKGCLERNRRCQQRIYDIFAPSMMVVCLRYSRSREEAEEIMQDAFVRMFGNIGQFKYMGSFEGWLRRIVVNCALQRYRGKYSRTTTVSLTDYFHQLPFVSDIGERLDEKRLIQLIQVLPPACRMVFNLYVFEGYKHSEIAGMLGVTEGTSKSNLFDARSILKRYLTTQVKIAR